MRARVAVLAFALAACAGAPPEPAALDLEAHARLTVEGFREASAEVAARLDAAAGWAVFPDIEDTREGCAHEGILFRPDAPSSRAVLRCSARPAAPAGVAYHALVVLDHPAELERLREGPLDLTDSPHVAPHDDHAPLPETATSLVVTSVRGGLLFDPGPLRQVLELADGEAWPPAVPPPTAEAEEAPPADGTTGGEGG